MGIREVWDLAYKDDRMILDFSFFTFMIGNYYYTIKWESPFCKDPAFELSLTQHIHGMHGYPSFEEIVTIKDIKVFPGIILEFKYKTLKIFKISEVYKC